MDDELKSKSELINELKSLRKSIAERTQSEHKEIEDALYKSETIYRNLVEQSPFSIQIIDVSGKTIQVNKAWEELWGLSWEEFSKIDYNILEDEQLKELELRPYLERAFAGEVVSVPAAEYDAKSILGKGEKRWVSGRIYPVKDKSGNIHNITLVHEKVSESKLVEDELKISDLRLKMIVRASNTVIWDWNIVTNELDWNDSYYQTFGYLKDDTTPTLDSWTDFIHPDDIKHTLDSLYKVVESGEMQWNAAYRFKKMDDSYAYTLDWGTVIQDEDGKPIRMIGIMLDISEQKEAELKLQKSENRFRQLAENINQVFWIGTPDWEQVFYVSPAYEKLWGLNRETLYANARSWIESVHPDDQAQVISDIPQNPDDITDVVHFRDYRIQKDDGQILWIKASAYPVNDSDGKVVGITGFAEDITERKLAEAALLENEKDYIRVQEEAHFGSWNLDLVKNKLVWSDENYRIFGMPAERPKNTYERFLEIVHPDDVDYVDKKWMAAVNNNAPYDIEHRLLIDNQITWVREVAKVVHNEKGEAIKGIGITQDITERKLMEEELLKVRKLESIGLLAGGIAHDFNNLLTGLFGNIELAKLKLTSDHAAYSYLQNAGKALDKTTNLTKQLLTFAKGGDPILEEINVERIIRDTAKLSLSGSNVKMILNLQNDLWLVKADKGQLSQVITNLVINADQAMPTGGTLTIEAENIKLVDNRISPHLSGEYVKLSIIDDGTGISADDLKLIFDPYFSTKKTGSGLGLATVHSIIAKHNGHIDVVSEPGVGTTFTIHLPAVMTTHQITETSYSGKTEQSDSASGHILIMDDDEMIQDLATEMIESFGYTVDSAVDGNEAIEKYISAEKSGNPFDVVIMDLTIRGGLGGKEATKELLALNPEVKAIVSSGYSTDPIMANYKEYGFTGRLSKPFQMDELQKELFHQIEKE